MIQETVGNTGKAPREVSADVGYYSAQAVDGLYALGVDPYVAPDQTRHGSVVPPAPRGRIPGNLSPRDRLHRISCPTLLIFGEDDVMPIQEGHWEWNRVGAHARRRDAAVRLVPNTSIERAMCRA